MLYPASGGPAALPMGPSAAGPSDSVFTVPLPDSSVGFACAVMARIVVLFRSCGPDGASTPPMALLRKLVEAGAETQWAAQLVQRLSREGSCTVFAQVSATTQFLPAPRGGCEDFLRLPDYIDLYCKLGMLLDILNLHVDFHAWSPAAAAAAAAAAAGGPVGAPMAAAGGAGDISDADTDPFSMVPGETIFVPQGSSGDSAASGSKKKKKKKKRKSKAQKAADAKFATVGAGTPTDLDNDFSVLNLEQEGEEEEEEEEEDVPVGGGCCCCCCCCCCGGGGGMVLKAS